MTIKQYRWGGSCKVQAPILKELAPEIKGKARIIKIDVDKNQTLAMNYQVRSVPTLILFKNGQLVWRHSGVASKQELLDVMKRIPPTNYILYAPPHFMNFAIKKTWICKNKCIKM